MTFLSLSKDSLLDQPELWGIFFPQFIWLISLILANKTKIAFWYFSSPFINCMSPRDLGRKQGMDQTRKDEKMPLGQLLPTLPSSFMSFAENQKEGFSLEVESCWCAHSLSLSPCSPQPHVSSYPAPQPRSSNSTLPFRCPEGEDMSQHSDLKVWAASESSECNHFRKSRTHNYRESHPPHLSLWPDIYSHSLNTALAGVEL